MSIETQTDQNGENFDADAAMRAEAAAQDAAARIARRMPHRVRGWRKLATGAALIAGGLGVAGVPAAAAAEKPVEPDPTEQSTDVRIVSQDEAIKLKEKQDKITGEVQKYKEVGDKLYEKLHTKGAELTCFFGNITVTDAKRSPILVGPDRDAPDSLIGIGMKQGKIDSLILENPLIVRRNGQEFIAAQTPTNDWETSMFFIPVPKDSKSLVGGAGMTWEASNYIKYPKRQGIRAGYQDCKVEELYSGSVGPGETYSYAAVSMPALSDYEGYESERVVADSDVSWSSTATEFPRRFAPYTINPADLPEAGSPPTALPRADAVPTAPPSESTIPTAPQRESNIPR